MASFETPVFDHFAMVCNRLGTSYIEINHFEHIFTIIIFRPVYVIFMGYFWVIHGF